MAHAALSDYWGKDDKGQPMEFPGRYMVLTFEQYDNPILRAVLTECFPHIQIVLCEPTCLH